MGFLGRPMKKTNQLEQKVSSTDTIHREPPFSSNAMTTLAEARAHHPVASDAAQSALQRRPPRLATAPPPTPPPQHHYVELGTIHYVNLTRNGKHGDYHRALEVAREFEGSKPILANFVEWPG
jgi:hypothetical protein